jgi:hypothetical protein
MFGGLPPCIDLPAWFGDQRGAFMKQVGIILLFCGSVASSSAQAIECLSAPNRSESGWWSWREIDGRKCWYIKNGAVPPKSEFEWPEREKEAPRTETRRGRSQPRLRPAEQTKRVCHGSRLYA